MMMSSESMNTSKAICETMNSVVMHSGFVLPLRNPAKFFVLLSLTRVLSQGL
jgi:hypothetical protein